jgi:hypothetical protein
MAINVWKMLKLLLGYMRTGGKYQFDDLTNYVDAVTVND